MPAKKPDSSNAVSAGAVDEPPIPDPESEEENKTKNADLFRAIFKNSDSETSADSSKEDSDSDKEIKQEKDGK